MSTNTYILAGLGNPRNKKEEKSFYRFIYERRSKKRGFFSFLSQKKPHPSYQLFHRYADKFSPYDELEKSKKLIQKKLGNESIYTFHYFMPQTHPDFFTFLEITPSSHYYIIPTFPHFSYFYTGNIAQYLSNKLPSEVKKKLFWVKSFALFPELINGYMHKIKKMLQEKKWKQENTLLLFSASSLPKEDKHKEHLYFFECHLTYRNILKFFPFALGELSYQGGFYYPLSNNPSTHSICSSIEDYAKKRKNILIIPLSLLTYDWYTLHEIEHTYLPLLKNKGFEADYCSPLSFKEIPPASLLALIDQSNLTNNEMLIPK